MANIDQLEKVYRIQTDVVLDMAKPLFFLLEKKRKRSDKDAKALRTLSLLWAHLFREVTHSRRINILTQTHPNHIGLLSRAVEKLPIGGEDLFGAEFVNELISQVRTATLVNSSVAGPSATSTPGKLRRSPPPLHDSRNDRSTNSFGWYVKIPFASPSDISPIDWPVAGRTGHFVDGWARLTRDPWVLSTVENGFELEFIAEPPFQRSIPPNASMDAVQLDLCSAEVESLIKKGAIVETEEKGGYVSRYFLVPKKGKNKSETVPTQCIEYIGLITNSVSMTFCLTDKKICDIRRLCEKGNFTFAN
ncbi:hypothetical protein GHT06_018659 [Daphnia sinensis]|uniref:Uncharacterized protein n=1 Tax=Daphnia sinensis TaxID=1820382 RepID=A0AAD5KP64_9CRUS|nr:hypothetical protein GHT06_018659 [Daphnia sinensis]